MERFFFAPGDINGDTALMCGDDVNHILKVLRIPRGGEVLLCDGQRNEYIAKIKEVSGSEIVFSLSDVMPCENEPQVKVTLYQALPKQGKLETIIQKCVELGVSSIQPVLTKRCVKRPDDFNGKLNRYRKVSLEAAKQSQRGIVPEVFELKQLTECDFLKHELTLLAYEGEREQKLKDVLQRNTAKDIAIIIGTEGGFEIEEVENLKSLGVKSVSLGRRILRTETAGMAMLAMVMYELE